MTAVQKRTDHYIKLMTECKARLEAINVLVNLPSQLPKQIVAESCYLQLRMLCETIAIGCLVMHGDMPAARSARLLKTWQADKILEMLAKLHPKFYQPTGLVKMEYGFDLVDSNVKFLDRDKLPILYRNCGERLHKGSLKKFVADEPIGEIQARKIRSWRKQISNLLQTHYIANLNFDRMYLVSLNSLNDHVTIATMESGPPPAGFG